MLASATELCTDFAGGGAGSACPCCSLAGTQTKQPLRTELRSSTLVWLLQDYFHFCILAALPSQMPSVHMTSKGASATHHEGFS